MADNIDITAGSGTTIATDDCTTGQVQLVKLAYGANGDRTQVPADADGLLVNLGANNDITGTVTANLSATDNAVLDAIEVDTTTIAGAVAGTEMQVDVVAALPTGDNNIGNVDIVSLPALVAGSANIGDVDVLTVPADPFGVNADAASATGSVSAKLRFIAATGIPITALPASTNTIEVVGDIAHDTGVSGNPVQVAGAAIAMADSAPGNRVSAAADVTRIGTDLDGTVFVHPHGPQIWHYHLDTSTAQTDTTVHASPGGALCLYVTDIVFSSGAATAINLFFEEGASKVLGPYYLEAIAGRGMALHFQTPKKITAATALTLTTSASIAHCVDITGFVA